MGVSDRLQQIIDYLGLSPNSFATKLGVSQPRMRNYLQGRNPDYEILNRICITFVMIDARWLLSGEGAMLVESDGTHLSQTEREKISHEILLNNYKSGDVYPAVVVDKMLAEKNIEIDKRDQQIDKLKQTVWELNQQLKK